MAADYCTIQEIKDTLVDTDLEDDYDDVLERMITDASSLIDSLLKREPGAFYVTADTTRYFSGSGTQLWIGELAAAPTTVSVAETGTTTYTTWAATDYICWPWNALSEGMPYQRLDIDSYNGSQSSWYGYPKAVKIVGKFGFSATIPNEIKEAAIVQVIRWWKRAAQAYQDAGAIVELGQMRYVRKLDPDVETIISLPKFQVLTL